MKAKLCAAAALAFLALPGYGDEARRLTLNSHPQGALVLAGNEAPQGERGVAGQSLTLRESDFLVRGVIKPLHFTLRLPEHEPASLDSNWDQIQDAQVWPTTVYLKPVTLKAQLRDTLTDYWGAIPAALIASGIILRLRSGRKQERRRNDLLQRLYRMAEDKGDIRLGQERAGYILSGILGAGGFGKVYRAIPTDTLDEKRAVALKIVEGAAEPTSLFYKRYQQEIAVCRQLEHPCIMRLLDSQVVGEDCVMVLELIEGETLWKWRETHPYAAPQRALERMDSAFQAVAYLHRRSVIHRDLQPQNLMIDKATDTLKIIDFGLAVRKGENYAAVRITGSTEIKGTEAYLSPEQRTGLDMAGFASDQFTLGAVLYELIHNEVPYANLGDLFAGKPLPFRSPAPPAFGAAVMQMVAGDAGARFPDLESARLALWTALELSPPPLWGA